MKTIFTFLLAILMATAVSAQNVLVGGNMESEANWMVTNLNGGTPNPVLTWNETTYTPSMGEGGCLRITTPGGASPSSTVAIYQAVTLEAGKLYTFNGAFIDNAGGLLEAGIQVYLGTTEPGTTDYTDGWLCEYNSWVPGYEPADRDDTFETGASGSGKLLCTASGTYYLVVKVGLWNTHTMDISLDELSLTASEVVPITGGGLLQNGSMETMGAWIESTLNSNPAPVSAWGYSADSPQYGDAGCLRLTGTKPASDFTNFCIYQKVSLVADKTYEYDLAFKDISDECKEAWVNIYLGSSEPLSGADYTEGKIGLLSSWNPAYTPSEKDITFQSAAGDVKNFVCTETKDYYFVIKAGSNFDFDFLFDEVYFREKGTMSAVEYIKAEKYKILAVNSRIVVEGVTSKVELFDLSGRCLQSQKMSGTYSSKMLNTGLYIIRVDGFSSKIVVR